MEKPDQINYPIEITQSRKIRRIKLQTLWEDLLALFELEQGVFMTIIAMFRRPAHAILDYLGAGRYKYANPFRLLAVLVAIATVTTSQLGIFDIIGNDFYGGFYEGASGEAATQDQFNTFQNDVNAFLVEYFNLITFAFLPFMGVFSYLFYRKSGLNIIEHVVVNTFIMIASTIFYIYFGFMMYLLQDANWYLYYFIITVLYQVFVFTTLFYKKFIGSIVKASLMVTTQYVLMFVITIICMIIYLLLNPDIAPPA